jgi:DNA replication protein DnaC
MRSARGGEGRIETARFPARKTLEEFDFTFQRSVKKTVIEHLGQLDCLHGKQNMILLGPPGTAKRTSRHLSFTPLVIVDQVACIPFDPEAANLMLSLVSNRDERVSTIVTSNKPSSAWGEIFGDDMAATAMNDWLIHLAEILSAKGDTYRLRVTTSRQGADLRRSCEPEACMAGRRVSDFLCRR